MRLTIPRIGTPYRNASRLWQVMRWLIPFSIATIALLVFLYPAETFGSNLVVLSLSETCIPGHGMFDCKPELSWEFLFFLWAMIPTIILYRLVIALGERYWTKNPVHGAIAAVVTLALLPPSIDYLLVKRTLNNLEFVSSVPDLRGKTILLDQTSRRAGNECAEYCLRLLYGSKVNQVIVLHQPLENLPKENKTAASFRLGGPKHCAYNVAVATTSLAADRETKKKAMGQIASGNCIAKSVANIDQADYILKLEIDIPSTPYDKSHLEFQKSVSSYGVSHAQLSVLEEVTKTRRDKLLQFARFLSVNVMQYPTALKLWGETWFSSKLYYAPYQGIDPIPKKFESAGLPLGEPEDIGFARTEELLIDTINNKERRIYEQDRWWIRNYLSEIAKEKLDTKRIDIISKMISDPRFDSSDLYLFIRVVPKIGNERLVDALINRIRSYPATGQDRKDRQQDIKTYSSLIMLDSEKATWSRILPDVRKITRDKTMMVYASPLMRAYGAGNSKDAEDLLTIYQRLIREHALDDAPSIRARPEYQRYKERRRTRSEEIQAILTGLCALADKSEKILPTLKASAAENLPSMGGIGYQIWKTMVKFDVDVEQMGRELQVNSESLNRIRSTSQGVKLMQERNRDGLSPKEEGYDSCVKAAA